MQETQKSLPETTIRRRENQLNLRPPTDKPIGEGTISIDLTVEEYDIIWHRLNCSEAAFKVAYKNLKYNDINANDKIVALWDKFNNVLVNLGLK